MIILVSGTVSVIAVNIHSALPLVPNAVWWMHRLLLFLHCLEENVFHSTRMKKNELQVVYNLHLIHVRLVCCVKIVLHLFRPLSCDDDFLYWSVPHFHPITFVKHFDLTVYSQRWAYNKICKTEYFLTRLLCTKFYEWHPWCLSDTFWSITLQKGDEENMVRQRLGDKLWPHLIHTMKTMWKQRRSTENQNKAE